MPSEKYQSVRIGGDKADRSSYELFFPLEMTNKDYMRRILDIVAIGIQGPVVEITNHFTRTNPPQLEPIEGHHNGDVYYLLKQILGRRYAPDQTRMQTVQGIFAQELNTYGQTAGGNVSVEKMVEAAQFLLTQRNQLFHLGTAICIFSPDEREKGRTHSSQRL